MNSLAMKSLGVKLTSWNRYMSLRNSNSLCLAFPASVQQRKPLKTQLNSPITRTGSPRVWDGSLWGTKCWFPMVPVIERFYCIVLIWPVIMHYGISSDIGPSWKNIMPYCVVNNTQYFLLQNNWILRNHWAQFKVLNIPSTAVVGRKRWGVRGGAIIEVDSC